VSPAIAGFRGPVLGPGDAGYDEARAIWNGAIDRRPALIARCTGTADVVAAVRHAGERGLDLSVRGGGHHVAGHSLCDGGLVVDCSPMRGVLVDAGKRRAGVRAGVLWGELDAATQRCGLATTGGVVTHTGIAGLTLGGGIGWLMRKHGLTADNLLSARVVTAAGEVVRAGAAEDADLLWALRGGGGNFGVVTRFEYRLHEVGPRVLAGALMWPLEAAPAALRLYRDVAADAPDELTSILILRRAPDLAFVPEELRGRPVLIVAVCWAGDPAVGARALRSLREHGPPLLDRVAPRPYLEHQSMLDPVVPHGLHWYWRSCRLPRLADPVLDLLVEHAGRITSPLSYTVLFQLGGAVGRVAEDATACSHRSAGFDVNVNAGWRPGDEASESHVAWARGLHQALEPHSSGVYVNFLMDEGEDRLRAAYGTAKLARLAALKARYDPGNVFHHNQNIRPASLD
jgi:FAD/FMN-containing dehydrogenase